MPKQPIAATFRDKVEEALKNFTDPRWLGEKSPLAVPFLLSRHLELANASPQARGRGLQSLLRKAAMHLADDPDLDERYRKLIQLYYFENKKADAVGEVLGLGNDAFHTSRKRAIASLTNALTRELQPALTTESPPKVNGALIDRTAAVERCWQALRTAQTVAVAGVVGSGKTTIGSVIAAKWGENAVFWHTIRPGFNDYLETLLFHLGYFLRTQGAPNLWLELTAAPGRVNLAVVSGLLRHAFDTEVKHPLLLCIDGADSLTATQNGEHAAILNLLAELRGHTAILLLGQPIGLDVDCSIQLDNLSLSATAQYLQQQHIALAADQLTKLHQFTDGNPLLLSLFCSLHHRGGLITEELSQIAKTSAMESLLGRIFQPLSTPERGLIMELAIVQDGAPTHAWVAPALEQSLHARQLLQTDGRGKIWLLPAFAATIEKLIPADKLLTLHERVAQQFATLGQFSTAAYHYVQANLAARAITLWRDYQQQEVNQGQASRALHIFRQALSQPLQPAVREQAILLCATLERTIGNSLRAQEDLKSILFKTPLLAVEADALAGEIANDHAEWEEAEQHFQHGIAHANQFVELQLVRLHKGFGWRFRGEGKLDLALQQAQFSGYELENFMGIVEDEYCNYPQAEAHYQAALTLAEQIEHTNGIAKTCNNLTRLYAKLGRFREARQCLSRSDHCYLKLGKRLALAENKQLCAVVYNLEGDYAAALDTGRAAFAALQEWNIQPNPLFTAYTNQAIAEAHFGVGNMEEAETYVQMVIATKDARLLPDAYRTYAEILYKKQAYPSALGYLENSIKHAQSSQDAYLEAYAWRVKGQVSAAMQNYTAMHDAFATAIQIFTALNLDWEAEKTEHLQATLL